MSTGPEPNGRKDYGLKQVSLRRKTTDELDRLYGRKTSYADQVEAEHEQIVRSRLVDKVRGRLTRAAEALEEDLSRITHGVQVPGGVEPRTAPAQPPGKEVETEEAVR